MSLLESAKAIHDSGALDPEDPAAKLEHVRLLRDTGDFSRALAVLGPAGEGEAPALVAERISALSRRCAPGDAEAARSIVERARTNLFGHGPHTHYLVVAVARWLAGHGRVRDGLRLLHEYAATDAQQEHPLTASATLFTTRTLLLLRLGWHPAIRHAIREAEEHGFLDADPASDDDGTRAYSTIRRLVTAGRMSARIGDVANAVQLLRRAETAASVVHRRQGFWLPTPRRWHAHVLRGNGRPHEALRLLDGDTDVEPVNGLACPIEANPMILLEKALALASRYDGTDTTPLDRALEQLDRAERSGGRCPELRWTRCRLLRRKGAHEYRPGAVDNAAYDQLGAIAADPSADAFAKLEYGQSLVDRGEPARACEEFARILRTNPHHREVLLAQAITVAESADSGPDPAARPAAVAEELCDKLIDDASILAMVAERFAQRGHYEPAERIFAHTNEHNPANGLSWAGRIRARAWQRDFTETANIIDAVRAATDRQPHRDLDADEPAAIPQVRITLAVAMVHADQQRYAEATGIFDAAHRQWRSNRDGYGGGLEDVGDLVAVWRATGLRWESKHDDAIALLKTANRENPHAAAIQEELGWAHLEIDRPTTALSYFDKARDMEPERSGAWRGRIQALRQARRFDEGIAAAARARRVLPRDVSILCELAWLYGERNQTDRALPVLADAIRFDATSPQALAWRIIYLTRERRHREATAEADRARAVRPESTEVLDAACYAHMRAGEADRAHRLVTEAVDQRPADLAVLILAASVFAQAGAPKKQWRKLAADLTARTDIPQAVRTGLSLYRVYSDLAAAGAALAGCPPQIVASDAGLLWERIELAVLGCDFARAEADILQARRLFPHSRSMVRSQATIYTFQERFDDAIELLEREIAAREVNWDLKATLAEVYMESGRSAKALAICRELRRDKPIRVAVVEVRAVRATAGIDEGLRLAQRIQAAHPKSRRVNLALARSLEDVHKAPEGLGVLQGRIPAARRTHPHHRRPPRVPGRTVRPGARPLRTVDPAPRRPGRLRVARPGAGAAGPRGRRPAGHGRGPGPQPGPARHPGRAGHRPPARIPRRHQPARRPRQGTVLYQTRPRTGPHRRRGRARIRAGGTARRRGPRRRRRTPGTGAGRPTAPGQQHRARQPCPDPRRRPDPTRRPGRQPAPTAGQGRQTRGQRPPVGPRTRDRQGPPSGRRTPRLAAVVGRPGDRHPARPRLAALVRLRHRDRLHPRRHHLRDGVPARPSRSGPRRLVRHRGPGGAVSGGRAGRRDDHPAHQDEGPGTRGEHRTTGGLGAAGLPADRRHAAPADGAGGRAPGRHLVLPPPASRGSARPSDRW